MNENTTSDRFKFDDAGSYDKVVADFDQFTERYSTYIVPHLLGHAGGGHPKRVVDIGCGSGLMTFACAEEFGKQVDVVGVDLSDGMLSFARKKAMTIGVSETVRFINGDAENLDIEDQCVDLVVSLYAFRHFPNPSRAAAEIFRILKPTGRIVVAVGSAPKLLSRDGVSAAFSRVTRLVNQKLGKELTACDFLERLVLEHIDDSENPEITNWSEEHHHQGFSSSLSSVVNAAGFSNVASSWIGQTFVVDSVEEFWSLQATFSSLARKRLATANANQIKALKEAFWDQANKVKNRGGRLYYRVGASIVSATKAAE